MKGTNDKLHEIIASLQSQVGILRSMVESLAQERDTDKQQIVTLLSINEQQAKRIVELEARLVKYEKPALNSLNSSIPSSAQGIKAKAEQIKRTASLRKKSDKKSGGQLGHKGTTLQLNPNSDEIVVHAPEFCTNCGGSLLSIEGTIVEKRQSIDIPLPIHPIVTDHHLMQKQCTCGCCTRSAFPNHVRGSISYGVNIHALVAYLNVCQHIPFNRLKQTLAVCYGVHLSEGTIDTILNRMKSQSDVAYEAIRLQIEKAAVVGADESGAHINGKNYWMWTFQHAMATFIFLDKSRGKVAIDKWFPNGLPKSSLISDRHSAYFNMIVKDHQLCLAHLLRNLTYLEELDKKQDWATRWLKILQEAIHLRKENPEQSYHQNPFKERIEELLNQNLESLDVGFIRMQKALIKHKDKLFLFLKNPQVPYHNNGAERSIRPLKIKLKVSGQFKSDTGGQIFCQLHSIADTAKKNNQSPFLALVAVAHNC